MLVTPSAIRVLNASKSFKKSHKALNGINLSIAQGECVGLLGASGSGKSTLLRSLCGLERLDGENSEIQIWGDSLQKSGHLSPNIRSLRRHIGIIFQQFNLVGCMDVLTNVMTGLLLQIPPYRSLLRRFATEERPHAPQALHAIRLTDQALHRASTLAGQQQRSVLRPCPFGISGPGLQLLRPLLTSSSGKAVFLSVTKRDLPRYGSHTFIALSAATTPLRLGHKSFLVFGPLALLDSAFYADLIHRLAIYAPPFLTTLGHPHAVAQHSSSL